MITLSNEVKNDIELFLDQNWDEFRQEAENIELCTRQYNKQSGWPIEENGLQLTIACNSDGTQWNFQTGDNSFTGGAYGLEHWAITEIMPDSELSEELTYIIDQLEDLLAQ